MGTKSAPAGVAIRAVASELHCNSVLRVQAMGQPAGEAVLVIQRIKSFGEEPGPPRLALISAL